MSTEITSTAKAVYLPTPSSFEEAYRIAKVLAASDLVPKDYREKPENCLVAMQWGADIGLPGLQALQNIAVINGRPSIWGDAAKALVLSHPACDDIEESIEGDGDGMVAVCIVKRKGKKPVEQRFSVTDAKKAGLWNKSGPWQAYPKRMLQMRARGFALRDAFPDALRGLVLAEEAQDYQKDMGNADVVEMTPAIAMPKSKAKPEADLKPNQAMIDGETGEIIDPSNPKAQAETRQTPQEPKTERVAPSTQPATETPSAPPQQTTGMIQVVTKQINNKQEEFDAAGSDFNVKNDVLTNFGITSLDEVTQANVNAIMKHIKAMSAQ